MSKYKNAKTVVDGIKFDSKGEAARYRELVLLQNAGKIDGLELQVPFVLIDKSKYGRKVTYKADFTYHDSETGEYIVEDFKGVRTPVYRLKRRLMAEVLGIVIFETGR